MVEYTRQSFKDDLGYRFKSVLDDIRHLSQDIDTQLSEADKLLYACEHLRAELDKNVVPVIRAGDTPIVKQFTNSKRLSEEVPARYALVKKYRDEFSKVRVFWFPFFSPLKMCFFFKDVEDHSVDLNISFDAAIQELNVSHFEYWMLWELLQFSF